jgi:hypothetical protein
MKNTADHTFITYLVPIEESAFPIVLSYYLQVLVQGEGGKEKHLVLDRGSFYELLDDFQSDSSIERLLVNAHTPLGDSSMFILHYSVTRTEKHDVLAWEQTIFEHERQDYFSRMRQALKGNSLVHILNN